MDWREAILSGLVVVVGVMLAHHLEQRASRMREIRRDALELGHVLGRITGGYISTDGRTPTGEDSDWWEHRQRAWELLGRLRVAVRGTRMRRGREVRDALDRILATLGAADTSRSPGEKRMPKVAVFDLTTTDLERALFPRTAKSLLRRYSMVQQRWAADLPSYLPPDSPDPLGGRERWKTRTADMLARRPWRPNHDGG